MLRDGALDGALNMARDHALARALSPDRAVLRLYGWRRPTVSLGRNEPSAGLDRRALAAEGVDVVRRPTGGRAVLHHREVTYAAVLPLRALGGLRPAYRALNRALVRGLSLLGVEAALSRGTGRTARPDAGPCFLEPAEGEVVAGGRKLVGSAQARVGGALLQHGSILVDDDQGRLGSFLSGPAAGGPPPATLGGVLGAAPSTERIMDAVVAGFRAVLPGAWEEDEEAGGPGPPRWAEVEEELEARYRSADWTWRR